MLIRFRAENYRSIAGPVELSMVAVDRDRPATRAFATVHEQILTAAGLYGANASGKTNVLQALAWLSRAVRSSLRAWGDLIPTEPFRFGDWPARPTSFEVELLVDGVRYSYLLELDERRVLFEGLYSYPERRRRQLIEREGDDTRFRRGLGGAAATRELLTPTTLALSSAMRFHVPEVSAFGVQLAEVSMRSARHPDPAQPTLFGTGNLSTGLRDAALELLRFADLGIEDVRIEASSEARAPGAPRRDSVQFVHRAAGQDVAFALSDESDGTITWFSLIARVLQALTGGRVLLLDELDASLHPRLSARLIELFQDPATNRTNAQLIFTAHDTSLLNHLNRDEVWLTEKNSDAATQLTALAEFGGDKVRRSLNLERAYLQGRFGAVPDLDERHLRNALRHQPATPSSAGG